MDNGTIHLKRPGNWRGARLLLLARIQSAVLEGEKEKKALLLFKSHYCCMLWWEPLQNITNRKGIRLHCWAMGAKGRTGVVSLPEYIASWEGGTRHLYLCCADSAQLSFREADEEEWPCGRTYWAHLYLSSSCESQAAESAAPPLFPSPFPSPIWMGNDLSALAWHPLCLQAGALTLRSWCTTSPTDPCRHRLISASVSHVLNTGQHSSSTPALVTVTIFQKEGKTKRWGKIVNNNEKKAKHALILCIPDGYTWIRLLQVEIFPGLNGGDHKGGN